MFINDVITARSRDSTWTVFTTSFFKKYFNTLVSGEANQSALITSCVAKRAIVMFLQVFVILSPTGGEVLHGTRSPPPGPGQNIYSPPHLGLGHSTHPPWDLITPPPHLRIGHSTPPPPPPGTWPLHRPPPPRTWSLPVADPGFSPGGCANSQKCYYFSNICQKLHENERIWTPRGGAYPWCPPLRSANDSTPPS